MNGEQYKRRIGMVSRPVNCLTVGLSSIVDGHPEQDDADLLDMYSAAQKYLHDSVWVTKEGRVNIQITFTTVHKQIPQKGQKVIALLLALQ